MPDSSRPTGAVFLSYAREDGEAARRIAEALRAFGVEVWFDMSELRGGDAWDAKIKKQIRECALFIPVISAATQAREEGYFRREWKQAVDRTHDMAENRAFIVPVLIDATRESDANVPEQFLKAHCTRLPGGEPTPQFVEQVKRLLSAPRSVDAGVKAPGPASATAPAKSGFPVWAVALLGVVIVGLVAFVLLRPPAKSEPAATAPAQAVTAAKVPEPAAAPATGVDEKSIAVLPFVNMSTDKEQEFFADGISEELLNQLAKIHELRVIARTSSFAFKGKEIGVAEIAKQLNVAHVLEGSIRKSGSKIRITAQLIRAGDSSHLWSETYDRSLDDIFAVQDEIAAAVVAQLKVTLLGVAPKAKAANPRAYALFLQARQLARQRTADSMEQAIALYQQALVIDPSLAAAWAGMADCYTDQADAAIRSNDEGYRLGREAVNKALAIDPDLAPALASLAYIVQTYDGDLATAARYYERALTLEPANTDIMEAAMVLVRGLGRFAQATALAEYVIAHDPVNSTGYARLGFSYVRAGRYDDAIASMRTALRLNPGRIGVHYTIGAALLQMGEAKAALAEMQQESSEAWRLMGLTMAYHAVGQKTQSDATLAELIKKYEKDTAYNVAYVLAFRGETDRAFEWLDKAVAYHDPGLADTSVQLEFANIHPDPRWLQFLRRIKQTPEELAAIKFDVKLPGK
jgi:TolB-like protein/Tfp pilus assembly protein PilF